VEKEVFSVKYKCSSASWYVGGVIAARKGGGGREPPIRGGWEESSPASSKEEGRGKSGEGKLSYLFSSG